MIAKKPKREMNLKVNIATQILNLYDDYIFNFSVIQPTFFIFVQVEFVYISKILIKFCYFGESS